MTCPRRLLGSGLDRTRIKWLAMVTMALNHAAAGLMDPSDPFYEAAVDIGYFTAITMCFFLVEGYRHTRSKKRYGMRLLGWAVLSQTPFYMATGLNSLNMLFTLFCCFMILYVKEYVEGPKGEGLILLFFSLTLLSDWAFFAPAFTWMFSIAGTDREKQRKAYGASAAAFALVSTLAYAETLPWPEALIHGVCSAFGIVMSGVVVTCFYNGEKARPGKKENKWAFYLFYPAHLLVIGCLKPIV